MHKLFADWYNIADLELDEEKLKKRWQGVNDITRKRKASTWLDCVRLFLGYPKEGIDFSDEFERIIKDNDSTFLTRENRVELQILAGSAIVNKIENEAPSADVAALAVKCAYFDKRTKDVLIPDVIEKSEEYIAARSKEVRQFREKDKSSVDIQLSSSDSVKSITKLSNLPDNSNNRTNSKNISNVNENVNKLVDIISQISNDIERIKKEVSESKYEYVLSKRIDRLEEEANVLWWLFGEKSRDLNITFDEIGTPGIALVAAKELADLTEFGHSVPAANSILNKALKTSESKEISETSLYSAVNSADEEWRGRWIDEIECLSEIKDIAPVLRAINMSLSAGDGWKDIFDEDRDVSCSDRVKTLALANQAYNECVLAKLIEKS